MNMTATRITTTKPPAPKATKTRHLGSLKLQSYDPRLGLIEEVNGKERPKFPMKWGHGLFHFKTLFGYKGFLYMRHVRSFLYIWAQRGLQFYGESF